VDYEMLAEQLRAMTNRINAVETRCEALEGRSSKLEEAVGAVEEQLEHAADDTQPDIFSGGWIPEVPQET
jgi:predicted  nucleic acid-binding Zn-ribbon protein